MSESPYMKLWVGDFLADTMHLSHNEVGQYILLLMAMWKNGGTLPRDQKTLKRVARGAISDAVMAYFDTDEEGLYQKRLRKELENCRVFSAKQRKNAEARWAGKPLKDNNPPHATAVPKACLHSHSHSQEEAKASSLGAKRATKTKRRISPEFQPRDEDIQTLRSEGFSLSEIQTQLVRFRDYWIGTGKPMADWDATFRNWVRKSAEFGRGQGPPGQPRRDGMRIALDKLGGNQHGAGLGTLSEFLALSGNDSGGEGVAGEAGDKRASHYGGKVNPLSISEGEQSN